MKIYILLAILIPLVGCSSKIKLMSEPPEAIINVSVGDSKEKKSLGKTPLQLTVAELEEKLADGDADKQFYTLEFSKEGFETRSLSIPYSSTGTLLTELNIRLKKGEDKKEEQQQTAEVLINKLFLAQRFALTNQFERALIELDKILEEHPKFSRALSMKGSIYLAQKKYDESLKWYELAIKEDPQMEETVKLAAKVRKLASGRAPAGRR